MPMLPGTRKIPGTNRYRLPNGQVVTRWHARNLGAQKEGFKNETARRNDVGEKGTSHSGQRSRNDNYYKAFKQSELGQQMLANAQDQAKLMRTPFNEAAFKADVLAARNGRPRAGKPGQPDYQKFMAQYGGRSDWIVRY